MIIFNIWAILVVGLICVVCLPFHSLFPELMKGEHGNLIIGIITAIVGGVTEYFGIRGRLFFLPIWLIGLGIVCYQIGVVGVLVFGAIVAMGIFFLIRKGRKISAENWKNAQEELSRIPQPGLDWDVVRFWKWVDATMFFPSYDYTSEMREHNLKVLDGISKIQPELTKDEVGNFALFKKFLEENKGNPGSKHFDSKVEKQLAQSVKKKLSLLTATNEKPALAAVPPKISSPQLSSK